jgi:3-dehydroquinate synthase class II
MSAKEGEKKSFVFKKEINMKTQQKEIWFQVKKNTSQELIEKAFHLSYSVFLVDYKDLAKLEKLKLPLKTSVAVQIKSESELCDFLSNKAKSNQYKYIILESHDLISKCKSTDYQVGLYYSVNDKKSLDTVVNTAKEVDLVIINFSDPTNIPLELVLATTQKENTRVFKLVNQSLDGKVSMLTMEHGSDGIVLSTNNINDMVELDSAFNESSNITFNLEPAKVVSIQHAGMGTRVCVDTTTELYKDEGMILGSTSSGGIFTCSETHYLPYMDLRPFRVNAGGLHLYVWGQKRWFTYLI